MAKKRATKLTEKQTKFVKQFLIDLNATQAAIRAGYSKKTAQSMGSENLSKPLVANAIQQALQKRAIRTEITADRVIAELAKIAFSTLDDFVTWGKGGMQLIESSKLTPEQVAAVQEVSQPVSDLGGTKKIKLYDKIKALELLGRHMGAFPTKIVVEGGIDITPRLPLEAIPDDHLDAFIAKRDRVRLACLPAPTVPPDPTE